MTAPELTAIDLFAGAGGISLGLELAGFRVIHAVEANRWAATTYRHNNSGSELVEDDVRSICAEKVRRALMVRRGELTILAAGPPCQGFSESNRRTRTQKNTKNHLYREVIRWAKELKPQWVMIENVTGLLTLKKGVFVKSILAELAHLGYDGAYFVLDASNFGVPQLRRRLFVLGSRDKRGIADIKACLDSMVRAEKLVSVREAVSDLPVLKNGASVDVVPYATMDSRQLSPYQVISRRGASQCEVSGNLVTRNSELVVARYAYIPEGGNWESIPEHLMGNYADKTRCHTGIYHRLSWDRPAKVIGNFRKNMLIHPAQDRGLSIREAARLQSFPDRYRFFGSIGFQQQQVADAVPPLLAMGVAELVKAGVQDEPGDSGGLGAAAGIGRGEA